MVENDDTKYTVGYGKPPRHTQFKPGQSGNTKGRPRKAKTVDDVLYEEFNRFVTITEGRQRRRLSKLRVVVRQNINKAASGDIKAAAMLLKLLGSHKSDEGDNLDALVEQFRARHQRLVSADQDEDQRMGPHERKGATEIDGVKDATTDRSDRRVKSRSTPPGLTEPGDPSQEVYCGGLSQGARPSGYGNKSWKVSRITKGR